MPIDLSRYCRLLDLRSGVSSSVFQHRSITGLIVFTSWSYLSALYYALVHLPPLLNVEINLLAAVVASLAVALIPRSQSLIKLYLSAFSLAFGLSSLQLSIDQPGFTPEFILFATLHLGLLGAAISFGSMLFQTASLATNKATSPDPLVNFMSYVFIALAITVALIKGVRLAGFLDGIKTDGNLYKIGGVSGVQGLIMIYLFCCFSLLSRINRIVFISTVICIAILDVKRGDVVRLVLFMVFYVYLWLSVSGVSKSRILFMVGLGLGSLAVLVIGGEVRQEMYSPGFSISLMLNSRINIAAIDWLYGYFGITASVLQRYFETVDVPPGYFPQLLRLALTSGPENIGALTSINGFNAGTALSIFAGNGIIVPRADFIFFCVLVAIMTSMLNLVPIPSLRAFLMLQVFGLVFGNQLILPYYLAGFFSAAFYMAIRAPHLRQARSSKLVAPTPGNRRLRS